jgi:polar amino acid transport system ATP-binding protein
MALIEIRRLHKHYGSQHVLKGIDLQVQAGQVVALIGRSGSGKSSLLRTLNGLTPLDGGEIDLAGTRLQPGRTSPAVLRELRAKVGMVFQRFNLFPHLSALRNVTLALRSVKGLARGEAEALAAATLAKVGLGDRLGAYPAQLSGGQQQRVAIARALAMSPQVLLCDEITSALDPELTSEVLDVVRQLAAEGMTLLMATHEMAFAREVSDQVVFLQDGRVHESGDPRKLFSDPATAELRRFIGAGVSASSQTQPPTQGIRSAMLSQASAGIRPSQ